MVASGTSRLILTALLALWAPPSSLASMAQKGSPGAGPDKLVAEGRALYEKADYGAALLKFEEAVKQGAADGELFYQMGYCYKAARDDLQGSRDSMQKAIPLLEQKLKDAAGRSLRIYYYLAAIRLNEIPDSDKLNELAREATAAVESGDLPKPRTGEEFFQLGRLYGFLGKRDKAAASYEKAIDLLQKAPNAARSAIYLHCLQAAAEVAFENKQWSKAADLFRKLLSADPGRHEMQMPLALSVFRLGKELEAAEIWQQAKDPRLEDQKVYLVRVARRYVELGRPAVVAPESDEDLRKAILEAGRGYAEARVKDDQAADEAVNKWLQEQVEARKAARRARKAGSVPAEGESEETVADDAIKWNPPLPPPSPERLAAEKKFFGLLAELVRRGQMVGDFAVTNGLATAIFK